MCSSDLIPATANATPSSAPRELPRWRFHRMLRGVSVARILFEPWGLGDTLVAVATAREMTGPVRLACQEKWHALLRLLLPSTTDLLPVTLPYTLRDKPSRWRRGPVRAVETGPCEVLSIRGDPRDWLAARDLFPRGKIRMSEIGRAHV